MVEERAELDLAVAQHVGIVRAPPGTRAGTARTRARGIRPRIDRFGARCRERRRPPPRRSGLRVTCSSVSSSQFFMKTPTTSKPCVSTSTRPPTNRRRPTCRRSSARAAACQRISVTKPERPAPVGAIVVDAAHDERAAVQIAPRCDLFRRQPHRAQDADVERPRRRGAPGRRRMQANNVAPLSDASQRYAPTRADSVTSQPVSRAFRGSRACSVSPDSSAGRLIESRAVARFLLDQQVASVALDDRRDRNGRARRFDFSHDPLDVAPRRRADARASP